MKPGNPGLYEPEGANSCGNRRQRFPRDKRGELAYPKPLLLSEKRLFHSNVVGFRHQSERRLLTGVPF